MSGDRNHVKSCGKRDIWLKEYALPFTDDSRFEITVSFKYDKLLGIQWKIYSMQSSDLLLMFALKAQNLSAIYSI